jgi:MFS transporter, DHA1 family, tetracycline resistance protein
MSWVIFGIARFVPGDISFIGISLPLRIIIGARVCDGVTGGNTAVIQAYIADISNGTKEKTKLFGMMAAMMGLGVMLGPLIGGLSAGMSSWGSFGTIVFAMVLSLITFIMVGTKLPPSPYKPDLDNLPPKESILKHLNIFKQLKDSVHDYRMGVLWVMIGMFFLLFLGYTTIYVLHAQQVLWFSIVEVGLIGTMVWLCFAFHQLVTLPRINRVMGPYLILLVGHVLMVVWLGLMTSALASWSFILASLILVSGISLCLPLFNTLLTSYARKNEEWRVLGLKESLMAAASVISPLAGATLYLIFSQEIFIIYALVATAMLMLIYKQLDWDDTLE